jgi:hypothetical protein
MMTPDHEDYLSLVALIEAVPVELTVKARYDYRLSLRVI